MWECAYAELHFTPILWPDFDAADLRAALADLRQRQRRFGGVPEPGGEVVALRPRATLETQDRRQPSPAYEEISR